jgi:hypothetical protein
MVTMITFRKKPKTAAPDPVTLEIPVNSPKRIEEGVAARRKKADSDGTRRRARQTVEENRLL